MEISRRLINLIGASLVLVILVAGFSLLAWPLFGAAGAAAAQVSALKQSNADLQSELGKRMELAKNKAALEAEVAGLQREIPAQAELRDVSAVASSAAASSGARITAISFGDPQVFTAPSGGGVGPDGKPIQKQTPANAKTAQVQIPVTIEAEVANTTQATRFIDGLRTGSRLFQIVQATTSQTTELTRYTVTVDALIFSLKG